MRTRRQLLRDSAAFAFVVASGGPACQQKLHPGVLLNLRGQEGYTGKPEELAAAYGSFYFVALDLKTFERRETPVPFPAHSINTHPRFGQNAVLVEKWGPHAATFDYATMTQSALVALPKGRQFIGHCAFHEATGNLFVSEGLFPEDPTTYAQGIIGVRDPYTLELKSEFSSYGENPHEIALIENGRTLVVANQGTYNRAVPTYANLTYIDVETGALIEQLPFPNRELACAHMRAFPNGDVVMITKVIDLKETSPINTVYTRFGREPLTPIALPTDGSANFVDEILSCEIDPRRMRLCTTCPAAGTVMFWDLNARRLMRVHKLDRPLGVALTHDFRHFVVNDVRAGTHAFDAYSTELVQSWLPSDVALSHFTAPHSHIAT